MSSRGTEVDDSEVQEDQAQRLLQNEMGPGFLEKASKCIELDDKGFQEKEVWMERA
jgi:hypothetical protein